MVALQLLQKPCLHSPFSMSNSKTPAQQQSPLRRPNTIARVSDSAERSRRQVLAETAAATAASLLGGLSAFVQKGVAEELSQWERVYGPIDPAVVLLDIAFIPDDPALGFLLGTRETILETKDGGNTWMPRSISSAEEDLNYRFNSTSFEGKEGWIVGKPAILLYTSDAGETWKRIPLNSQLPADIHHHCNGNGISNKVERQRFFDSETKSMCWVKAERVPGRHPGRWRKDAAGNIVFKRFHSCQGCLCYEFDHIIPFSKGGQSVVENCQILQTRVNKLKSDKENVQRDQLRGYSCDINFRDNELDAVEIAVHGDVLRPGNECRSRTINETLGKYKTKNQMAACKLP